MKQVMIDLETLGLGHAPPIVQIGACTLDQEQCFEITVIPEGVSDAGTMKWWQDRGGYPMKDAVGLSEALRMFNAWLAMVNPAYYWANDPQQDIIWLESAYLRVGMCWPWKHNNTRSYRTVRSLTNGLPIGGEPAHSALEDCRRQSELLLGSLLMLGQRG